MNKNNQKPVASVSWSPLSVRITVMVFWGLAFFGFVIAITVFSDLEQKLSDNNETGADRIAYRLSQYFNGDSYSAAGVQAELENWRKIANAQGIEVRLGGRRLIAGETDQSLDVYRREQSVHRNAGKPQIAALFVYYTPLPKAVTAYRANLLMLMSLVLLAFGFLLVWVLRHLLTGPFTAMHKVAQAFSAGDVTQRFNAKREDEFGYLAQFINKALDQMLAQQAALFQEKERAEVTLHSIGDGVITTDAAGNVEYLNPVAVDLTGWTLADARGQP